MNGSLHENQSGSALGTTMIAIGASSVILGGFVSMAKDVQQQDQLDRMVSKHASQVATFQTASVEFLNDYAGDTIPDGSHTYTVSDLQTKEDPETGRPYLPANFEAETPTGQTLRFDVNKSGSTVQAAVQEAGSVDASAFEEVFNSTNDELVKLYKSKVGAKIIKSRPTSVAVPAVEVDGQADGVANAFSGVDVSSFSDSSNPTHMALMNVGGLGESPDMGVLEDNIERIDDRVDTVIESTSDSHAQRITEIQNAEQRATQTLSEVLGEGNDASGQNIQNLNNVQMSSVSNPNGNDVIFYDRPRSKDGLYVDKGTAYFDQDVRTSDLRSRGGGDIITRDRIQSRDGLYVENGRAYFNDDVRTDELRARHNSRIQVRDEMDLNDQHVMDVGTLNVKSLDSNRGSKPVLGPNEGIDMQGKRIRNVANLLSESDWLNHSKRVKQEDLKLLDVYHFTNWNQGGTYFGQTYTNGCMALVFSENFEHHAARCSEWGSNSHIDKTFKAWGSGSYNSRWEEGKIVIMGNY